MSGLDDLPDDILDGIFDLADRQHNGNTDVIFRLRCVCRTFRRLLSDTWHWTYFRLEFLALSFRFLSFLKEGRAREVKITSFSFFFSQMDAKSTHILDLPDEILLRISKQVVMIKPDAYAVAYPVDVSYFRLRYVCRRFRAVLRNKPHLSSLGEWHEREYDWPLLEQAHAYDEKNEAARKLWRAEWLTKQEAARKRSAQNSDDKQESLSHSSSFLT
jgi:hypothetical protein